MNICKCGIAAADCDYHRPEPEKDCILGTWSGAPGGIASTPLAAAAKITNAPVRLDVSEAIRRAMEALKVEPMSYDDLEEEPIPGQPGMARVQVKQKSLDAFAEAIRTAIEAMDAIKVKP